MPSESRPRVGLFIPCYIDQLFPQVGMATVEVLERLDVEVEFPNAQTCCGQPMANTGCNDAARPLARKFLEIFKHYRRVVCPSASCVAMVRHHYDEYLAGEPGFEELKHNTFELCEFIHDVLEVRQLEGRFSHHVGLHQSCHGLRELRLAKCWPGDAPVSRRAGTTGASLGHHPYSNDRNLAKLCPSHLPQIRYGQSDRYHPGLSGKPT